ncbi:MAG: HNH endonuclease domain-containing protein [Mariprofundaceae bacterium]
MRRKQNWRRKHEIKYIEDLYPTIGLSAGDLDFIEGGRVHQLRADAATQRVELPELMRVFKKMRKRRGYKGRFRERKNKGKVQTGVESVEAAMKEHGCDTLGQYLLWRHKQGLSLKLKHDKMYAHRDMLKDEFGSIWNQQERHHTELRTDGIKQKFEHAIFRQLPLKSPAPMVGRCELEPSLPRAPRAQMLVQEFVIEKQISDLRWDSGEMLSEEQKNVVRDLLNKQNYATFVEIYDALDAKSLMSPDGESFTIHKGHKKGLKGNTTLAAMRMLDEELLEDWLKLSDEAQIQIINFLADLGSPEILEDDDWHDHLVCGKKPNERKRTLWPDTVAFINRMVECESFDRLGNMGFDSGRAEYSLKAIRDILPRIKQKGMDETEARKDAYPQVSEKEEREFLDRLPMHSPTGNVVVDVALREMRREVNRVIEAMGCPPTEVIIEMSRDMALGQKKREEISGRIAKNERARKTAAKELKKMDGVPPSSGNILRYLLWENQSKRFCPYCDRAINNSDAFDGHVTHIEHIIPFKLTRVGRQRSQLVLAHRTCNDKKGDRTPWEVWGGDEKRWAIIEGHAKELEKNKCKGKARQLLMKDVETESLDEDAIKGFTERQFHESSWIAKAAAKWMRQLPSKVFVSRGALTAYLRRIWGLETVIPQVRFEEGLPVLDQEGVPVTKDEFDQHRRVWEGKKPTDGSEKTRRRLDKRIDHRHHMIDALVIGMCSPRFYEKMAWHYKEESEKTAEGKRVRMKWRPRPPLENIRELALERVRECKVSHKPDRYSDGQLFEEYAYKLVKSGDEEKLAKKATLNQLIGNKKADQIRSKLETIVSPATRKIILDTFEKRLAEGVPLKKVFDDPVPDPRYPNASIRRVDMTYDGGAYAKIDVANPKVSEVFPEEDSVADKYFKKRLVHNGYAYLESNPEKKDVRLLSPVSALQNKGKPVEEGYVRIFKGDVVRHPNGNKYVVRQIKSEGGGMLVCSLVTETRPVRELSSATGLKMMKGRTILKLQLANE